MTTKTLTLLQDASRGLSDALASKPDAKLHAREAAAAIAAAQPAPAPPAPITEDARIDPRRSTLALCRAALDMLTTGSDVTCFSDAHASALQQAVDAFEAATRLESAVAAQRERCITAAEDAYIAGKGAKGCIDAVRALCEPNDLVTWRQQHDET